jgi:hypothetical protein
MFVGFLADPCSITEKLEILRSEDFAQNDTPFFGAHPIHRVTGRGSTNRPDAVNAAWVK